MKGKHMHLYVRRGLTGLAAALLLALAVSSASARNLSVNEQGFSIRWSALELNTSVGTVRCPITLRGSFHRRTITKTNGLLIGAITGATVNDALCTNGRLTVLTGTLPWSIHYASFAGTLPRIDSIRLHIRNIALQNDIGGQECLFRTDTAEPLVLDTQVGGSGETRSSVSDGDEQIDLEDEDFLCAIAGDSSFSGTGVIDGNIVEPIVVRLIA
jgi:hypothetical protein